MFDTKVCQASSPRIARALMALMRTSCFTTAPWSASLIMTSLKPSASSSRRRFSRQKARFPAVCKALLFTSSAPLRVSSYTAQGHSFMPCTPDCKRKRTELGRLCPYSLFHSTTELAQVVARYFKVIMTPLITTLTYNSWHA